VKLTFTLYSIIFIQQDTAYFLSSWCKQYFHSLSRKPKS